MMNDIDVYLKTMNEQCMKIKESILNNKNNISCDDDKKICEEILRCVNYIEIIESDVKKLLENNKFTNRLKVFLKLSKAIELMDSVCIQEQQLSKYQNLN